MRRIKRGVNLLDNPTITKIYASNFKAETVRQNMGTLKTESDVNLVRSFNIVRETERIGGLKHE
ncbi:hypothetical protein HFM82_14620 [Lactobacillus plantarum]|uniref:hypothetical protein n=1 Tax=Lactiplantibacillus plantarum TaxID=1590 RepID=UPI00143D925A|nr:hypothetical protein [Lactiplantibacillus plantarum]MBE1727411.1 hypothetical protein [Lactiplantibacillus plantarum]NKI39440.1 hypothetical protein [Lactiplantibacillus plantarum]